jgi:hypothetical protein
MMLALDAGMRIKTLFVLAILVTPWTSAFAADTKTNPPEEGAPRIELASPEATRPSALPAMYVSFAGLQAYDGYSTLRGVRGGAAEIDPLVGGLASQPAAFWTLKALSTVTTIYFAEQLWRQHKRGQAIMTMVVAHGVMGAVAARNASILKSR